MIATAITVKKKKFTSANHELDTAYNTAFNGCHRVLPTAIVPIMTNGKTIPTIVSIPNNRDGIGTPHMRNCHIQKYAPQTSKKNSATTMIKNTIR